MTWVHHASPEVEAASQYRLILGVCLGLTLSMFIVVCLRLAIRFHARRLEASDYVMVVTMVRSSNEGYVLLSAAHPWCTRSSALSTAHYVWLVSDLLFHSRLSVGKRAEHSRKQVRSGATSEAATKGGSARVHQGIFACSLNSRQPADERVHSSIMPVGLSTKSVSPGSRLRYV